MIQHIKLLTTELVRCKGYLNPFKTSEVIETEIQEIFHLGAIKPSYSLYLSLIVLISRKDGSVRFCIDFRKMNKFTEFDAEPVSTMEEVINKLSDHKYFTKMDHG